MWDEQIRGAIETASNRLSQALPQDLQVVVAPAKRALEYAVAPLIDQPGRFPWWGMVAALCIAAYAYSRDRRSRPASEGYVAYCFPTHIWKTQSTWVDLKVGFMNYVLLGGGLLNFTWRITGALVASGITIGLTALFGPREPIGPWNGVAMFLFALTWSLLNDFGYFLFHWAAHVFPPLWAIHKLHHSAEVLSPLTAARVHPLGKPIMGVFMAVTTGVMMGPLFYLYAGKTGVLPALAIDVFGSMFFILGHHLHHSHIWVNFGPIVGRIIQSPAQHQIHHSMLPPHLDKNFAEHWALWDSLFGTLYLPKEREELKFGLAGYVEQPHTGIVKAWFNPIIDSAVTSVRIGLGWLGLLARWRGRTAPPGAVPTE